MGWILFIVVALIAAYLWSKQKALEKQSQQLFQNLAREREEASAELQRTREAMEGEKQQLQARIDDLARFQQILDAEAEAKRTVEEGRSAKAQAVAEAAEVRTQAQLDAKDRREKAEALMASANAQAAQIISQAKARAEEIGGDAYRALQQAQQLTETATAMKNVIEGYGDKYLKPTFSLLDELAEAYSFDDAGKELKLARERTKLMVEGKRAATCDYVEQHRKETAIHFVVDAFNGKVDSILTRSKQDNIGTLERQIRDAWALVNNNGTAFRNARITEEYLDSRLQELRWATAVMMVKEREREEQRAIRERIREEERARKEIEKALRDAAKEEESLQRALEKAKQMVAKANDEQRARYEEELAQLQVKLQQAEDRNRRAMSMAQQTRAGHVYVISNIGSFGENVYKIGMTRRLEPHDRVRELGDASVPFSFDVHAMIWSEDAPGLEKALHREFVRAQINKVNPRKEFFRVGLSGIRQVVEAKGIEASWTVLAQGAEYRETLEIERRLAENPAMATDWLRSQEEFEPDVVLAENAED
jgi:hypothetical protein